MSRSAAVALVLTALPKHASNPTLQGVACDTLGNLLQSEENSAQFLQMNGVDAVFKVLACLGSSPPGTFPPRCLFPALCSGKHASMPSCTAHVAPGESATGVGSVLLLPLILSVSCAKRREGGRDGTWGWFSWQGADSISGVSSPRTAGGCSLGWVRTGATDT